MKSVARLIYLAPILIFGLIAHGCGSGGGSSTPTGATGVFLKDGPVTITGSSETATQVIVTVKKIELKTDGGSSVTVYNDATGFTVDLLTLASTSQLLGFVNIPEGTYTKAEVTIDGNTAFFVKGSDGTTQALTVPEPQFDLHFATPLTVTAGQASNVVIDMMPLIAFDGTNYNLSFDDVNDDSGEVETEIDMNEVKGTVQSIDCTAGTMTISVDGKNVTVTVTNATFFDNQGSSVACSAIGTGTQVQVKGTMDAQHMVTATMVRIDDVGEGENEVNGTVLSVGASTMDMIATDGNTYTVDLSGSFEISNMSGGTGECTASATDLAAGQMVDVEGTLSGLSLSPTEIKIRSGMTACSMMK